jgi:hypothetical protein
MLDARGRGTGKWGQPGVPHKGWTCVDIEDLGTPDAVCEMCESQEIRYIHHMTHLTFSTALAVGCVCAGKLEEDYDGARQRESSFRNAQTRRKNWLKRKWSVSTGGNLFVNVDGYNVVVFPDQRSNPRIWSFRITNRRTSKISRSRKPYPTETAAKLTALEGLLWGQDKVKEEAGKAKADGV